MTEDGRVGDGSAEGGTSASMRTAAAGGGSSRADRPPRRVRTRDLLIAAAFGAMGAVLLLIVSPLTTSLAATFPPAYAVVAGVHSVLPYLARRLLSVPFAATLVGALVGVLSFASTPLGPLILVSLLAATLPFDLVLNAYRRSSSKPGAVRYAAGALAAAIVLFLVSLPLFSAERLTWWMVGAVIAGRIIGQCGAAALSALIAHRVHRAGIRREREGG